MAVLATRALVLLLAASAASACSDAQNMAAPDLPAADVPGPGVPLALAEDRAARVSDLRYELHFTVPDAVDEAACSGKVTIRFTLTDASRPLALDFAGPAGSVRGVRRGGARSRRWCVDEHVVFPAAASADGRERAQSLRSIAGDAPLNRNPRLPVHAVRAGARAPGVPVLRSAGPQGQVHAVARHSRGWEALANGAERLERRDGRTGLGPLRRNRSRSRPICSRSPPGGSRSRRRSATAARSGCSTARPTPRRSRATATRSSICTPRRSTGSSSYTGIPYPFGKFDFLLVPSFQFGGMEHPGRDLLQRLGAAARSVGDAEPEARPRQRDRARDRAHVVRRSGDDAVVQRRVDEGGLRQLHGGEDRQPVVSRDQPRAAVPAMRTTRRRTTSIAPRAPTRSGSRSTTSTRPAAVRRDHLSEGADRHAPARDDRRRGRLPRRPARVPEGARVRQRDLAGSDRAPRRRARRKISRPGAAPGSRKPGARSSRPSCRSRTARIARLAFTQRDPCRRARPGLDAAAEGRARATTPRSQRFDVCVNAPTVERDRSARSAGAAFVLPTGGGIGYGGFALDAATREYCSSTCPRSPIRSRAARRWSRCGRRCSTAASRAGGSVRAAAARARRARRTS